MDSQLLAFAASDGAEKQRWMDAMENEPPDVKKAAAN
jgi:hypothetical protein